MTAAPQPIPANVNKEKGEFSFSSCPTVQNCISETENVWVTEGWNGTHQHLMSFYIYNATSLGFVVKEVAFSFAKV